MYHNIWHLLQEWGRENDDDKTFIQSIGFLFRRTLVSSVEIHRSRIHNEAADESDTQIFEIKDSETATRRPQVCVQIGVAHFERFL